MRSVLSEQRGTGPVSLSTSALKQYVCSSKIVWFSSNHDETLNHLTDDSVSHHDQTGRSYSSQDYVTPHNPAGDTCRALRCNAIVVSLKALTNGIAFRSENLGWFSSNQISCTHGNSFCLGKLSFCCTK